MLIVPQRQMNQIFISKDIKIYIKPKPQNFISTDFPRMTLVGILGRDDLVTCENIRNAFPFGSKDIFLSCSDAFRESH